MFRSKTVSVFWVSWVFTLSEKRIYILRAQKSKYYMLKVNFIPKFSFLNLRSFMVVFFVLFIMKTIKKNSLTKKKKTITQNKTANKPETGIFSCRIDRKLYAISVFLPLNVPQWLRNIFFWNCGVWASSCSQKQTFFSSFFCSIRGRNPTSFYRKWTLVPLVSSMSLQIRASPQLHSCSLVLFNMTDRCTFYFSQVSGKYSNIQTFRLINLVGQPLFQNRYLCIKEFDIFRFSFFPLAGRSAVI